MARKPRVHFYGAIYHVIARGNNKEDIFLDEFDKEKYLELIKKYMVKFNFNLYAYALMNNHIHLLIEVKEDPLSKMMQGLQLSYTQYFNKKYSRVGHVFQQRYKSILCTKDEYLLTLIKYIHHNPIRAGLQNSIEYDWSSHRDYKKGKGKLVETDFVLNMFDVNPKMAVKKYLQFMQDAQEETISFTNSTAFTNSQNLEPIDQKTYIKVSLEELLTFIAGQTNIPKEVLLRKTKIPNVTRARRLFLYLAIDNGILSRTQAAEFLGISQSTVTKAFNAMEYNEDFKKELIKLQNELVEKRK